MIKLTPDFRIVNNFPKFITSTPVQADFDLREEGEGVPKPEDEGRLCEVRQLHQGRLQVLLPVRRQQPML
jgi:hypothetical protein